MEPRSKKGPSWKDSAIAESSQVASKSDKGKKTKVSKKMTQSGDDASGGEEASNDARSDLDWLKRHMKTSANALDTATETAFDQSDEDDKKPVVEVRP